MAGTLSRVTTFVAATPILSAEVNAELNQLVNLLNSTSSSVKLSVKVSDAGDAPVEANQLSTGPIQKWFQAGVEKARVRNDGSIRTPGIYDSNDNEELLFVTTASAVNELTVANAATGNPPELRATGNNTDIGIKLVPKGAGVVQIQSGAPVAGADAANKTYVDGKLAYFCLAFKIEDPSTFPLNDDSALTLIRIPVVTGGFLTKITIIRPADGAGGGGSHTSGGSVTFAAKIFNVSTIGSGVSFNNTNNAGATSYTEDFTDAAVVEGNFITVLVTARSGTVTERNVSINIEGFRKIT